MAKISHNKPHPVSDQGAAQPRRRGGAHHHGACAGRTRAAGQSAPRLRAVPHDGGCPGTCPPRVLQKKTLSVPYFSFSTQIGDLYGKDPLNLDLSLEYWCPPDPSLNMSAFNTSSHNYKPPNRQVGSPSDSLKCSSENVRTVLAPLTCSRRFQISLYKFVRHAGDLLPPSLYIPYIQMLTGLANGPQSAHHCYNLLKTNGAFLRHRDRSTHMHARARRLNDVALKAINDESFGGEKHCQKC